jgi:peptidoglycan/xylan/chitin deacetylase (PgdA/CDA1 family)
MRLFDIRLAIKVDVGTDRGAREGVPALLALFQEFHIEATFLFALGPDNTGRALRCVVQPGFFRETLRTGVARAYGVRTLLNGLLWPGPHIGRRNEAVLRAVRAQGHEVGIHAYDRIGWRDGLARMTREEVDIELGKARAEFERIFGQPARLAGAPGFQANSESLAAYDDAQFDYASDARGSMPFFARVGTQVFHTLQVPTTLPTLEELLGRAFYPRETIVDFYLSWLSPDQANVMTIRAEREGMDCLPWFRGFLQRCLQQHVRFERLEAVAQRALRKRETVPICDLVEGTVDGRAGTLAVQRPNN